MKYNVFNILQKIVQYGVVHRDEVKHDQKTLKRLLHLGFVTKVYKRGQVFYEFSQKALPLLESYRKELLEQVRMLSSLSPWSKVYSALLGDLRFLDPKNPEAKRFLFLSDWELKWPVVPSQLELSKYRYYEKRGMFEKNKAA